MAVGTPSRTAPFEPIRRRRLVTRLSPEQLRLLRRGFAEMMRVRDDRGYRYLAGIHGLPLPIGCDNAHGTPYFLPWHRAYLYFFERALRDRVADAMLAWWDWRTIRLGEDAPLPEAFSARQADGSDNPLLSAEVDPLALEQAEARGLRVPARTERRPGAPGAPPLPTHDEVERILALGDFLVFSDQLEELHNRVHGWVGGHMGRIPFASYDPIFWANHAMVDRIWRLWQLRHPNASPPRAIIDEALPPFRMTVRQTLDVRALGYDYAAATRSLAVAR